MILTGNVLQLRRLERARLMPEEVLASAKRQFEGYVSGLSDASTLEEAEQYMRAFLRSSEEDVYMRRRVSSFLGLYIRDVRALQQLRVANRSVIAMGSCFCERQQVAQ